MSNNEGTDDWNEIEDQKIDEQQDDTDTEEEDITPITPQEVPEPPKSMDQIGAILKNVPSTTQKEQLKTILFDFNYHILNVNQKYEVGTQDYYLAIDNDENNTITDKIIKFSYVIDSQTITMDLVDLPKKKNYKGGRRNDDRRGYNRDQNYNKEYNRRRNDYQNNYDKNNRDYNNKDYNKDYNKRDYNNRDYNNRDHKDYNNRDHKDYNNRDHKDYNNRDSNNDEKKKNKIISVDPETSILSKLQNKEISVVPVDQSNIFGMAKPRDEPTSSPMEPPSPITPSDQSTPTTPSTTSFKPNKSPLPYDRSPQYDQSLGSYNSTSQGKFKKNYNNNYELKKNGRNYDDNNKNKNKKLPIYEKAKSVVKKGKTKYDVLSDEDESDNE